MNDKDTRITRISPHINMIFTHVIYVCDIIDVHPSHYGMHDNGDDDDE